jgi:hypothetical protein
MQVCTIGTTAVSEQLASTPAPAFTAQEYSPCLRHEVVGSPYSRRLSPNGARRFVRRPSPMRSFPLQGPHSSGGAPPGCKCHRSANWWQCSASAGRRCGTADAMTERFGLIDERARATAARPSRHGRLSGTAIDSNRHRSVKRRPIDRLLPRAAVHRHVRRVAGDEARPRTSSMELRCAQPNRTAHVCARRTTAVKRVSTLRFAHDLIAFHALLRQRNVSQITTGAVQ